jgi:hypothetical protein
MPFPVDIMYVHEAERKLGVKFPASFVTKMARLNGGQVQTSVDIWQLHPFQDPSDRKRLARTCNDIVRETLAARKRPGFPPEAVSVGENGGGDELILLPQSDRPDLLSHEVYWWDHETDEIHKLADDFSELRS